MLPFRTMLTIDKSKSTPLYLQITMGLIDHIQLGVIQSGTKLPGSRRLADHLGFHRRTIVQAIDELEAQGWVNVIPYKGTFVVDHLPELSAKSLIKPTSNTHIYPAFDLDIPAFLKPAIFNTSPLAFSDGTPDSRLAPLNELATAYSRQLRSNDAHIHLQYGDARGNSYTRQVMADYFNRERGLNISADNIMVTRGSQMAIYLASKLLIQPNDNVAIGETNYETANICFSSFHARLVRISVDELGLDVYELEQKLKKGLIIRCIYITSHHHHPTTVTLSPERRLKLLELAKDYGFAIIEDDYSYDFHYSLSPILPLASADRFGSVIYIGSFSKSIAPAFRIGYIIAPTKFISQAAMFRRIIDRQGDNILELAVADLLKGGIINRYKKKALKIYGSRLNLFCQLFTEYGIDKYAEFNKPAGGMAAWVRWNPNIDLQKLSKTAMDKGLYLADGSNYNPPNQHLNAIRMGFANMADDEMQKAFGILSESIQKILN